MADATLTNRQIAGRAVGAIWALNFLLMVTDTVSFPYQSALSLTLAFSTVFLLRP